MFFQTLDDKLECVGIYYKDDLFFDLDNFPSDITKTWKYSSFLKQFSGIEYANLYLEGKPIEEIIPEYLKDDWDDASAKIKAFKRSLSISKVDEAENCFYDLVPKRFLVEFCRVKNSITKFVLDKYAKPKRYDFSLSVCKMLEDISNRKLNLNYKKIKSYTSGKRNASDLLRSKPYIGYNQFGTVTGRLTTKKRSFPILTLKREYRDVVEPVNDTFYEFDFNGAEARVLLGLLDKDQPRQDVHDFHRTEVFNNTLTREQCKTAFFAWLYGARKLNKSQEGKRLKEFYDKDAVVKKFWDGSTVETPLGKVIANVSEHHALNYIVQSTTAELTLLQAIKINHLLETQGSGSFLSCLIHDSVVVDLKDGDKHLVPKIQKLMGSTKFGSFSINTSAGKSLGRLKKQ